MLNQQQPNVWNMPLPKDNIQQLAFAPNQATPSPMGKQGPGAGGQALGMIGKALGTAVGGPLGGALGGLAGAK